MNTGRPVPRFRDLPIDQRARLRTALSWCYEPDKVFDIMNDRDRATNIDLGHWRRLCALAD